MIGNIAQIKGIFFPSPIRGRVQLFTYLHFWNFFGPFLVFRHILTFLFFLCHNVFDIKIYIFFLLKQVFILANMNPIWTIWTIGFFFNFFDIKICFFLFGIFLCPNVFGPEKLQNLIKNQILWANMNPIWTLWTFCFWGVFWHFFLCVTTFLTRKIRTLFGLYGQCPSSVRSWFTSGG